MDQPNDPPARPGFRRLALGLAVMCTLFAIGCLFSDARSPIRFAGIVVNGLFAVIFFSG